MMNFQLYVRGALYLVIIHFYSIYISSVCGNVLNVIFPPATLTEEFSYWELRNRLPSDMIEGNVVESHPLNACEPIERPPYPANSTLKWFVLIRNCDCSLDLKLRRAEDAGFDVVIVYSCLKYKKSEQDLFSSDVSDYNSTIKGIHINNHAGETIRNKYLYFYGYYVQIIPDEAFNLFRYIIPFVIAVGICMVLLMLFVLVKYIRERRQNQRNRLSSRHLKQLPVIKFKKGDHYDICAICLEEYNEGNKLRVLPCSHAYHTKCIDPWLTNNQRTCPVCKQKIRLGNDSSDSESDSESEAPTETTPLLRSLARRIALSRNQVSNRNFLRNPVINNNQPDVMQNGSRSNGESSHSYYTRPTLEQRVGPLLQHLVNAEHPTSESDNSSAYSASAPPFLASIATENDQPSTSSEQTSSLPNIASSTLCVEVIAENARKQKKMPKDMVV